MATKKEKSPEEIMAEKMKLEIAEELGLLEKVEKFGWKGLSSRESGRIGGIISKKRRQERKKENQTP